ncbi:hypothetical protein LCGC14_1683900 [marine sediment metagenome]|uniref:Uncharacterized protein n=1 Tax=marine sediment metagenome TaxID=412755 RepID=A0A0F9HMY4_9ZZZZ|nr:hypothetical protein [Phycisphaerales bacterium]
MVMRKIIMVIGVLIILEGIAFLIKPGWYRNAAKTFMSERTVYIGPVLKIVFGMLFLVSALSCHIKSIIIALGVLMIAGGITGLILPKAKIISFIEWWTKRSDLVMRIIAIVAIALGGLVMWAA